MTTEYPNRKLSITQEDEILERVEYRRRCTDKALCAIYDISKRTLERAVARARARRAKLPKGVGV